MKEIHEVIPDTRVVPTIHCAVDPKTLWTSEKREVLGVDPEKFFPLPHIIPSTTRNKSVSTTMTVRITNSMSLSLS